MRRSGNAATFACHYPLAGAAATANDAGRAGEVNGRACGTLDGRVSLRGRCQGNGGTISESVTGSGIVDFQGALRAIQAEEPARDHILISRGIERDIPRILLARLSQYQRFDQCTVFLTTYGGDPHAAFRVARCLRQRYKQVRLAVPSYCKSAGTLIAIGADVIALGDNGELGPLDVQVTKPTDVMERGSGLDYMQALQVALTYAQQAFNTFMEVRRGGIRLPTKQAAELATNMAVGIAAPLYAQIDPNRIGEMQRAIQIAREYGVRLDVKPKNLIQGALDKLVAEYPSHSFVIDREEAKTLFNRVEPMTPLEVQLADSIWWLMNEQNTDFLMVCEPADPQPEPEPNANGVDHAAEPELAQPAAHNIATPADPAAAVDPDPS